MSERDMSEAIGRAEMAHNLRVANTENAALRARVAELEGALANAKEVMPNPGFAHVSKPKHDNTQPQPAQSPAGAVMCPAGGYTGQPSTEPATVENCLAAGVCGCDEMAISLMLERVTKAIYPAFDHIKDENYRNTVAGCWARAAIEAMREPTDSMLEAQFGQPSPTDCWKAMIKAALECDDRSCGTPP